MRIKVEKAPHSKPFAFYAFEPNMRHFGDYVLFILGFEIRIYL